MTDRPDTLSRRMLMRGAMGAAAIAGAAHALAQRDRKVAMSDDPKAMVATLTDGIFINSNENPLGPAPAALRLHAARGWLHDSQAACFHMFAIRQPCMRPQPLES